MYNEMCGDNRFEIIAEAKRQLLEYTNIETSPDEMAVIDSFLFRCWQMGWLKSLDKEDAADVVEVRHGRWTFGKDLPDSFGSINKNKYHLYCSECRHQAFNKSADNDCDFDEDTPFCPWCGAKTNKEGV